MIYQEIQKQHITHKKNGNSSGAVFFSFLLGEVQNKAVKIVDGEKTYPDTEVVSVLQKIKKNIEEAKMGNWQTEISMIDAYMPKMLSENDIKKIFEDNPQLKNMGDRMKFMKETYPNQYDGKAASKIAKEM